MFKIKINLLLCFLLLSVHSSYAAMQFTDKELKAFEASQRASFIKIQERKAIEAKNNEDSNKTLSKEELQEKAYFKEADRLLGHYSNRPVDIWTPVLYGAKNIDRDQVVILLKAGNKNNGDDLLKLGTIYYWSQDSAKAIYYFKLAINTKSEKQASYNLGYVYSQTHLEADTVQAIAYYAEAVDGGDKNAKRQLGVIYMQDKSNKLQQKAGLDYLVETAEDGDFIAQYDLAWQLYLGEGVLENYTTSCAILENLPNDFGKNSVIMSKMLSKMTTNEVRECQRLSSGKRSELFSLLQ